MEKIRTGSIVTRKSYNNDILFTVEEINKTQYNEKIANLKGVTLRIKADAPLNDLCVKNRLEVRNELDNIDKKIDNQVKENRVFLERYMNILCGKILHLDGDAQYR